MNETDKAFNGFLRLVIRDLINEADPKKKRVMPGALLKDLQNTLED